MFFNAEDDEGDFMSGGSSGAKLGALFGIDQATSQGGNESLKYSAPKQPKKKSDQPAGGTAPSVLLASAVDAYKYVDGQYAKQGKLGAAILGSHTSHDYKILLYVSKQQQVTNVRVHSGFTFTIQPNNYASFYDDARQSWSIMFEAEQNAVQFSKQVCMARALSCGASLDTVISQDIALGEGGPIENGDSGEVRYTGWLLANSTFGKVFDSNANADKLFRFKVGKGKVIKGWDVGVIGMKKNGKRLLVVPPNWAYGSQGMGDRIPSNATLIFEIEVVRVKLSKSESPSESPGPTLAPTSADKDNDQLTIKGRSRSITEQLAQPANSGKAKLISRMAKMGQPMLPLSGAVAAELADDDEDVAQESPTAAPSSMQAQPVQVSQPVLNHNPGVHAPPQVQPQIQPCLQPQMQSLAQQPLTQPQMQPLAQQPLAQPQIQPMVNHLGQPVVSQPAFLQNIPSHLQQQQQLSLYQPPAMQQQQQQPFQHPMQQPTMGPYGVQPTPNVQPPQFGNVYPTPGYPGALGVNPSSDVNTPLLVSESRQHNTEVRLAVGKVSDRVDKILEKLEHIQLHGTGSSLAVQGNVPQMEAGVLLHNIQKIMQESERLKKELFEKSARIESQNEKIADLLQRNQRYVEQSNTLLEQRNDTFKNTAAQSQARVLTLEQEKVQFATELSVATAQLSSLQLELSNMRKKEGELKQQLGIALDDTSKHRDELNSLRVSQAEADRKAGEMGESLKEEKLTRRQLENKISQLQEELGDFKSTNETLDKNLTERKKKAADERKRIDEELEEAKSQYEGEIQTLKNKLRAQKSSTDAATAEQVAQIEEELNQDWQDKLDKMMKVAEDKHKRALRELEEEVVQAQSRAKDSDNKTEALKAANRESAEQAAELQSELEDFKVWKEKYENLRSQASTMKEKYEERISELEDERDTLEERVEEVQAKAEQDVAAAAKKTAPSGGAAGGASPQEIASEVKKIMSSVYHSLRGEFEAGDSYKGSEVLASILNTIKTVTLKLTESQEGGGKPVEEEEEESEEDSEEEEEDTVEDKPVVVETMSREVTHGQSAAAPPKKAEAGKPKEVKTVDDRSNASIEDDIMSQLIGASEMSGTIEAVNKPSSATKEKEPVLEGGIEPIIASSTAKITGDKGNIYHSAELDKSKPLVHKEEVVEEVLVKSTDHITGDRGNIYYSAELDKSAGENEDEETDESEEEIEEESEVTPETPNTPVSGEEEQNLNEKDEVDENIKESNELVSEVSEVRQEETDATSERIISTSETEVHETLDEVKKEEKDDNEGDDRNEHVDDESQNAIQQGSELLTDVIEGSASSFEQSIDQSNSPAEGQQIEDPLNLTSENKLSDEPLENEGQVQTRDLETEDSLQNNAQDEYSITTTSENKGSELGGNAEQLETVTTTTTAEDDNLDRVETEVENGLEGDTNNLETIEDKFKEKGEDKEKDKKETTDGSAGLTEADLEAMLYRPPASSPSHHSSKPKDDKAPGKDIKSRSDAPVEAIEEPMMMSSATSAFTMGSNLYHSQNLDNKGGKTEEKKMIQAEVIEPVMASSTSAALHSKSPGLGGKKHTVVEPLVAKATGHKTGDKGNRYYSEHLDKSKAPVLEPMFTQTTAHFTGDKGNPHHTVKLDQSTGKPKETIPKEIVEPVLSSSTASMATAALPKQSTKDKKKSATKSDKAAPIEVVEPMMSASSVGQNMGAPVLEPMIAKSKNYPTGDKGNVFHSAKLDQSKQKPKDSPIVVIEPVVVKSSGHPTGDKGNPHHTAKLDKSSPKKETPVEVVESMVASSTSSKTMGGKPYHSSNLDHTTAKTGGKGSPAEVIEPMIASSTASSNMAVNTTPTKKPDKKLRKGEVVEPMISKKTGHVTGDRGNVYHTAKLDASSVGKKPGKPAKPGVTDKPVIVEPLMAKSTSHPTGDRGNPHHTAKLDKGKEQDQKDEKAAENKDSRKMIPSMPSMEPPPLDDKGNGDDPLFGDDNTVLDTFGTDFKPKEDSRATGDTIGSKKEEKKSDKKLPSKTELLTDDSMKEKPPPLFGEEDDNDLDWLS